MIKEETKMTATLEHLIRDYELGLVAADRLAHPAALARLRIM